MIGDLPQHSAESFNVTRFTLPSKKRGYETITIDAYTEMTDAAGHARNVAAYTEQSWRFVMIEKRLRSENRNLSVSLVPELGLEPR